MREVLHMNGSIYQRPGSSFWYFDVAASGKRWRGSTKETDEALAQLFLEAKMKSLEGEVPQSRLAYKLTVDFLLDQVIDTMEVRRLKSLRMAKCHIAHLRPVFGSRNPGTVTAADVREYQKERLKVVKGRTVDLELQYLSRAYHLAELKAPKVEKLLRGNANARQGFLEPKQIAKFVAAARERDVCFGLFAEFIFLTGRRVGEVTKYLKSDVKDDLLEVRAEITKTARHDNIPLAGRISNVVAEAMSFPGDLLFTLNGCKIGSRAGGLSTTATRLWKKLSAEIGVPGLLAHDSRRSASRNMVRSGIPQRIAMGITGHVSDSMFCRYDIVTDDDVRSALARQV